MGSKLEKTSISMGNNLVIARKWKKMTQHDVAEKTGLHQTEISTLEKQDVIDIDILDRISKAMEIPIDFFTTFSIGEAVKSYGIVNYESVNISTGEKSSVGEVMQQKVIENQTIENQEIINAISIDKYNELVALRIEDAERIGRLKQQIEQYKKQKNNSI